VTIQADSRLPVPLIGRFLDPILQRESEKNLAWGKRETEKQAKVNKTTA
jgi:hypothetical protein